MNQKVENLKGKLIVSCQALPDEPLHSSFIMGRMALAAKSGRCIVEFVRIQKKILRRSSHRWIFQSSES